MYQPAAHPPTLTRPAPKAIGNSRALDHHYVFSSMTELAQFADKHVGERYRSRGRVSRSTSGVDNDFSDMVRKLQTGDVAMGEASNALVSKFEDLVPQSSAWGTRNDVVGSLPNVPAYLSGHPLSMRRRVRVSKEMAPLGVLVDMATSASVSPDFMKKRGALVLALVRMLQSRRAVTLHVTAGLGAGHPSRPDGQASAVYVTTQIDTTPLDLARAAYMLGSADWRYWAFGLAYNVGFSPEGASVGQWPYSDHSAMRQNAREIFDGVIPGADEVFFIGGTHLTDRDVNDPEKWLRAMLAKYGDAHAEAA